MAVLQFEKRNCAWRGGEDFVKESGLKNEYGGEERRKGRCPFSGQKKEGSLLLFFIQKGNRTGNRKRGGRGPLFFWGEGLVLYHAFMKKKREGAMPGTFDREGLLVSNVGKRWEETKRGCLMYQGLFYL